MPVEVDEATLHGEEPRAHTSRLATMKAQRALEKAQRASEKAQRAMETLPTAAPSAVILGADTVVSIGNEILGKPADKEAARAMLAQLSGRTHTVTTSFCLLRTLVRTLKRTKVPGQNEARPDRNKATDETTVEDTVIQETVESRVTFRELSTAEIDEYIETGEPMDKAGAYGVQGLGGRFVKEVRGSYTNVVGLPTDELRVALKRLGVI